MLEAETVAVTDTITSAVNSTDAATATAATDLCTISSTGTATDGVHTSNLEFATELIVEWVVLCLSFLEILQLLV